MTKLDAVPPIHTQYTVGIVYNLKKGIKSDIEDIEAEYDNIETVKALQKVFEKNGLKTVLLEVNDELPEKLEKTHVDLVFNIAEGTNGRGREGQVPALLSMLGIPYIGSDETTLCLALDKTLTKKILSSYHIKSPKSILLTKNNCNHVSLEGVKYPLIIKPNAEGSSKGISDVSIVKNHKELHNLAISNIEIYNEDMLAEEYIDGREFTVAILGNGDDMHVFPPMEIKFNQTTQDNYYVYSYNVKKNYKEFIQYSCPANLDKDTETKMMDISKTVFKALGCKDFSRVDFRLDNDNNIYFIEINPLPGLAPEYSDYPMIAGFCGIDYETIVMQILACGLKRLGFEA